jgi:hypothetical protein
VKLSTSRVGTGQETLHVAKAKKRSKAATKKIRLPVTVFTTGEISTVREKGRRFLRIHFQNEKPAVKKKQLTWGAQSVLKKLLFTDRPAVATNGATIESDNKHGVVLEIISMDELHRRFPHLKPKGRRRPASRALVAAEAVASAVGDAWPHHTCVRKGDSPANYYCDSTYCTDGSCTLHHDPWYCTCD